MWLVAIIMTKKPIQPQDKYVLRLPDGLRDRIKAYAEAHGRSMNTEIVRVLEREFPEPWTLDARVHQLLGALQILKAAGGTKDLVDGLLADVAETLEGVASGRVTDVDEKTRKQIERGIELWRSDENEAYRNHFEMSLDDEEIESLNRTGRIEKF